MLAFNSKNLFVDLLFVMPAKLKELPRRIFMGST
jgi:hypothetical protein